MLTLKEINEVSFGKAGFSGYKPEDVDNFIDEVGAAYKQLVSERDAAKKKASELHARAAEMQEKLSVLAKKIESYRKDEDGIKDAILSAQKIAKETVNEANDKAAVIVADAQEQADRIIADARKEASVTAQEYMAQTQDKKNELEEMKKQVSAFRISLMEMYKKHLEMIDHIPNFRIKEAPAVEEYVPAPTPAPVQEPAPAYTPPVSAPAPKPQAALPQEKREPAPAAVKQESAPVPKAKVQRPEQPKDPFTEKVDYTKELNEDDVQLDFSDDGEDDLTGIDMNAYKDIPEPLLREKKSRFSNLEFGDGIDVTHA